MKRSSLLLPLLLLAGAAQAQEGFDAHVADIGLLQAKAIQNDVGVTAAERARMNAAADANRQRLAEYQRQLKALGQTNPDPVRLRGIFDTLKGQVISALTPAQVKRVRELTLQRLGLISLVDAQVAKRVGLTDAQVGRLKSAYGAGQSRFVALQGKARAEAAPIAAQYKDRKPKSAAEAKALAAEVKAKVAPIEARYLPRLKAIGTQTDAAMLAVLTPAEKAAWTALKGKPFVAK